MKLTREEFDRQLEKGELRLAFVGMSNLGKSHRAEELEQLSGFVRYSVDEEIFWHLEIESLTAMSEWMGMAYDDKFPLRQKEYLELEEQYTKGCLNRFKGGDNFVLDTTGSVVHLPDGVRNFLRENFLVVNLRVPDFLIESMMDKFFAEPKPVVFGEFFQKKDGESDLGALKRAYPKLLKWRKGEYEKMADITLDTYTENKDDKLSAEDFWKVLRKAL